MILFVVFRLLLQYSFLSLRVGQRRVQILDLILRLLSTTLIKAPGSCEWSVPLTVRALMVITN